MLKIVKSVVATCLVLMVSAAHADKLWQENQQTPDMKGQQLNAKADDARYVSFQPALLNKQFLQADQRLTVSIPAPDGNNISIVLVEASVMEPALAAKFPGIKSYRAVNQTGQQIGRFSFSHKGLHGMYLYNNEWAYLDPLYLNQTTQYISYYRKNARPVNTHSFNEDLSYMLQNQAQQVRSDHEVLTASTGDTLTTYRLAVSTTGEFTQFHKSDPDAELGTVADGIAALNATVTRVNQVFLADVAVEFVLVNDNDQIVFTDPDTDPFNNDDDDISLNQNVVDNAIGTANYDVGHVFTSSEGGVAALESVCTGFKAAGLTGLRSPTGDRFYIDYVSHELGHQFNAKHSFNGTERACGNRSAGSAWEPGSGATIMGYATLCESQDLQQFSEALFHIGSVEEIRKFIEEEAGATCGTQSSLSNTQPTVNAGPDYTIPARTPFKLTGEASDADDDTLVYNWEQIDLGSASTSRETMIDDGTRPLFRTWSSASEPTRYFPRLSDVLANTTTIGETYPTTSRTMNFRLTVRDGKGGLSTDGMQLTTVRNENGFTLLQPSSSASWGAGSNGILVWDPAGSADAPVNCSILDLDISSDGGINFTSFASNIANDGVTVMRAPSTVGNRYRLKLNCSDSIFFAVHQADFAVVEPAEITDSDGDGIPDDWEAENGLDPNDASDASQDSDSDGLSNLEEYLLSTDPNNTDSDGDGVNDLLDVIGGTIQPDLTSYSFENDTDITSFSLGTENNWSVTEATAFDGSKSLVGADISHNQTTSFTYTGEFVAGDLTFYAKVSSEIGWDFLEFYIDDELQGSWSGELDWFQAAYEVSSGEHTIRWQYTKDVSDDGGADTAWIDLVSLPLVVTNPDPDPDPDPDPEPTPTPFVAYDYDGDSKADFGVRRPSDYHQYIRNSSNESLQRVIFGRAPGDIPISGDFDGDKIADVAVRRASNQFFYIKNSSNEVIQRINFGRDSADIPVSADYDGDGITDVAVRRASNQTWYIRNSSGVDALTNHADGITRLRFGLQEDDIPAVADYDGDGKADVAVRRPDNRFWYVKNSSGVDAITNNADGITRLRFGLQEEDIAVPADYDGDGKADFAVRRPSNFTWYIRNSSGEDPINGASDGISRVVFGRDEGDIPIVADYDGDGKADIAVRRLSNFFQYLLRSSDGGITRHELGRQTTDIPLAAPIQTKMTMASAVQQPDG